MLRISNELYVELEGWAQQEFRSVNAHLEYLLKQAVDKHKGKRGAKRRKKS